MRWRPSWRTLALALILLALGLRIPLILHRAFDPDEFQHLHGAYSIARGMVPYRDYYEHHTPWLHYLLRWLYPIWGTTLTTIFVARGLMLPLSAGILYLTYRFGRQLYGREVGVIASLFLTYTLIFLEKTLEIRPDVPEVVCWLGGLVLLLRGIRTGQERWYWLSGLAFGSAVMFTQKALFGIAGVLVALMWMHVDYRFALPWRRQARLTLALLGGLAFPIALTSLWFLLQGGLRPFIEYNFLMNARWKVKFWPYHYIRQFLRQNPFISVLGMAGWLWGLLELTQWERVKRGGVVPVAATFTLLIGLYVIPVPYRQYYLLLLPLWAIWAARLVAQIRRIPSLGVLRERWRLPRQRTGILVWLIALALITWALRASLGYSHPTLRGQGTAYAWMWGGILVALPAGWLPRRGWRTLGLAAVVPLIILLTPLRTLGVYALIPALALVLLGLFEARWELALAAVLLGLVAFPFQQTCDQFKSRNEAILKEIQYILDHTSPDDPVLTGWRGSGVFRPHAYFYFFLHGELLAMLNDRQKGEDVVAVLESKKPPIVVYDGAIKSLRPVVQEYIQRHYEPTDVGVLYRRK